jgi:hypothetical protein
MEGHLDIIRASEERNAGIGTGFYVKKGGSGLGSGLIISGPHPDPMVQ